MNLDWEVLARCDKLTRVVFDRFWRRRMISSQKFLVARGGSITVPILLTPGCFFISPFRSIPKSKQDAFVIG